LSEGVKEMEPKCPTCGGNLIKRKELIQGKIIYSCEDCGRKYSIEDGKLKKRSL